MKTQHNAAAISAGCALLALTAGGALGAALGIIAALAAIVATHKED
jgi:hypothetical protein